MDQETARGHVESFLDSAVDHPTLGLVYGRRRIGKSTLLDELTADRGGFYWEATRGESAVHLARLGEALGHHLDAGRLSFGTWEEAVSRLLRLGESGPLPVVLDEVGYLLESEPALDSVFSAARWRNGAGPISTAPRASGNGSITSSRPRGSATTAFSSSSIISPATARFRRASIC